MNQSNALSEQARDEIERAEELDALRAAIGFIREDAEIFRSGGLAAAGANDDRVADRLKRLLDRLERGADVS